MNTTADEFDVSTCDVALEMIRRKVSNSSQRAVADDMQLAFQSLSQILAGKNGRCLRLEHLDRWAVSQHMPASKFFAMLSGVAYEMEIEAGR